jgi:spermidine synthase
VYEVKLDDDFLMSSMFVAAEVEVARLALAALPAQGDQVDGAQFDVTQFDVVVGGLGLGYTAQTVLENPQVRSLVVVEALPEVIDWHERGLVPVGPVLTADPRCRLVHGDFFALAAGSGLDPDDVERRFDAVVVDIDHSPRHLLHPSHAGFYAADGLARLAEHLRPGGVFALWSNDPPDAEFEEALAEVFADVAAAVVSFPNPLQESEATNTVYLARRRAPG